MTPLASFRPSWWLSRFSMVWGCVCIASVMVPGVVLWLLHINHSFGIDIHNRLKPASGVHWLGTDPFGRDTLSLSLVAAVNSFTISVASMLAALVIGGSIGIIAAEMGKKTKILANGAVELGIAFPPVITAALLVTIYGAGVIQEILALAIFFIPGFIRLSQQAASTILAQDYIAAGRLAALNTRQIHFRHVLPNMVPGLLVQFSVNVALAILAETGLSYLGLGAPPPLPELGRLLASYQVHIFDHPLLVAVPGGIVLLLVLGVNLLGDGLRDLFARQETRA